MWFVFLVSPSFPLPLPLNLSKAISYWFGLTGYRLKPLLPSILGSPEMAAPTATSALVHCLLSGSPSLAGGLCHLCLGSLPAPPSNGRTRPPLPIEGYKFELQMPFLGRHAFVSCSLRGRYSEDGSSPYLQFISPKRTPNTVLLNAH